MDNMIKFYRGLVGNLPEAGTNGALYITTDEGAIYYGTGTGMKRLGDFIQVENVAALPENAHESCLYYCVAENILAKWNGSEWKQINKQPTTDELKTQLGLGTMAYKSEIAEDDLNAALKEKVNAAAEGNHSHANKGVLDGITAEKVAAWDAAEGNAIAHADGLNTAMDERVDALEAAIGENGSVATQIKTAIEALDFTDTAVDGEYVSAVNEIDGKISVTRKALPDYTNTYDAKGAADTAFENAKAYADGLAANYDEKGAAAGVKTELEAEIAKKVDKVNGKSLVDDAEIAKLADVSAGANKVEASENGKIKIDGVDTVVYTHPEKHAIAEVDGLQAALDGKQAAGNYSVEGHKHVKADITDFDHNHTADEITDLDATIKAYDYATKAEAQGYADAKDEAIAAALSAGETAQANLESYQESNDEALAGVKATADAAAVKADVDTALGGKVDKVEGYSLVADDEIARLAEVDNYDDEEVRGLIGDNADAIAAEAETARAAEKANADAIKAIADDYLKAADKEALQTQLNTIMNNPDAEGAINSINEFTKYVQDHGTIADGFRADIDKNKEDIAANAKAIADNETAAASAYETKDDAAAKLEEAKEYTDTAADAVIGKDGDDASADTIYGAKKYADEKASAAQSAAEGTAAGALASAKSELEGKITDGDAATLAAAKEDAAAKVKELADGAVADNAAAIATKANAADVYTKTEVDALLSWGSF